MWTTVTANNNKGVTSMKKLCLRPSVFLQRGSRQYQDTSAPDYQGSDLFKLAPKSCRGLWAHITMEHLLTSVALSGNDVLLFFSACLLTDCCKVQRQLVLAGSHFYSKTHCWLTHLAGSLCPVQCTKTMNVLSLNGKTACEILSRF